MGDTGSEMDGDVYACEGDETAEEAGEALAEMVLGDVGEEAVVLTCSLLLGGLTATTPSRSSSSSQPSSARLASLLLGFARLTVTPRGTCDSLLLAPLLPAAARGGGGAASGPRTEADVKVGAGRGRVEDMLAVGDGDDDERREEVEEGAEAAVGEEEDGWAVLMGCSLAAARREARATAVDESRGTGLAEGRDEPDMT